MSQFQNQSFRKDGIKPNGKLVSFFVQPAPRSISENGPVSSLKKAVGPLGVNMNDFIPQGKSMNTGVKRVPAALPVRFEPGKSNSMEKDERYQYLMKNGIIRRVEKDDKIIFAELPGLAGVLVVYRSIVERSNNPERLNLDRRDLTQMPLLESEERLRLLNYQHNLISKIENLLSLPNLIFLDLYNNQIKEINGLHTVPSLRVLMLGKNLIDKIKNLNSLTKLDVLDLHSNKIRKIENLSHLFELRVLNLANNQIQIFENLDNLKSLTEINLRRNFIEYIKSVSGLNKLQRLFLSNNKFDRLENVELLGNCANLTELALDGNAVQSALNYSDIVLTICKGLSILDLKKITSEMRDSAGKIDKLSQGNGGFNEGLVVAIEAEWSNEVERIRAKGLNGIFKGQDDASNCLVQSGHAEIENENLLFIYGNALEVLSKHDFHDSVHSIHFQYIPFTLLSLSSTLSALKKFQNLKKLILKDNNLIYFTHISKFESLQTLSTLEISNNDLSSTSIFQSFIVYRFPNITELNSTKVSENDRACAKQHFQHFDRVLSIPSILTVKNI